MSEKNISVWFNVLVSSLLVFYNHCIVGTVFDSGSATTIINTPVVIANSGSYKLSQDVVGTITINANKVVLDLQGNVINGTTYAITVSGSSDVIIKNGFVQNTSDTAIFITNAENIYIQDIKFNANTNGIFALTTTLISVNDCIFNNHIEQVITFSDVGLGSINNSLFTNNSAQYILVSTGNTCLTCDNLSLCGNSFMATPTSYGFFIEGNKDCTFNNCSIANNLCLDNDFVGFFCDKSSAITFNKCFITTNTVGLYNPDSVPNFSRGVQRWNGFLLGRNLITFSGQTRPSFIGTCTQITFNQCSVDANTFAVQPSDFTSSVTYYGYGIAGFNIECNECTMNSNNVFFGTPGLNFFKLGAFIGAGITEPFICDGCSVNSNTLDNASTRYQMVCFEDVPVLPSTILGLLDVPGGSIEWTNCQVLDNTISQIGFLVNGTSTRAFVKGCTSKMVNTPFANRPVGFVQNSRETNSFFIQNTALGERLTDGFIINGEETRTVQNNAVFFSNIAYRNGRSGSNNFIVANPNFPLISFPLVIQTAGQSISTPLLYYNISIL